MSRHISRAKLVMLQPANHEGLLERHKEVTAATESFIAGLG
jgi:hypothetical protein